MGRTIEFYSPQPLKIHTTMKYTIFTQFVMNFFSPWEIVRVLDSVIDVANEGHDVSLVYCDGKRICNCRDNMTSNPHICKMCAKYRKILYQRLPKSVRIIPLSAFSSSLHSSYDLSFNSIAELKKLDYKGVKIGYAAFSTYLTQTRNLSPLFDNSFNSYMTALLKTCCQYTDIVERILESTAPDVVACYNSRFIYSRPVVDLAVKNNIPHISYEDTVNTKNERVKVSFKSVAHNVDENTERINAYWSSDTLPISEKIAMAESFFYNRKHSIASGDKLYVKDQSLGLLPPNWDENCHNILILNSSEDEFASLGEEFENKSLFESQYAGIKHLISEFKDVEGYHFYLRVHPNLKNVHYKYHTALYDLFEGVSNFTIIPANSPISTYSLIDNCDKVVVFGSTTGPEAVYWGKPTILLSYCAYSYLNICYTPNNTSELRQLLLDKSLPAKDKMGALKYGYYRWNDENSPLEHYHCEDKMVHVLGKSFKVAVFNYGWLKKLRLILIQIFGKKAYYKSLFLPTKEA